MATQSSVRISNQQLIIDYLIENGQTSRADLSKVLNISKPTVSSNAEKLLEQKILLEVGEGHSSGGRKPTLLSFNFDYKIIVAIDLNRNQPLIALSNLSGHLLHSTTLEMKVTESKPFLVQRLTTAINDLITSHHYDLDALGAISLAIPGVIDDINDQIFANPQDNLWTDLNLKKVLKEIYHVPVMMRNDISMAALGEHHYGQGRAYDDLMFVSAGHGIGAGLIIGGNLLKGKRNFAGEIGFTRIGSSQTLEETIGSSVLVEKIKNEVEAGRITKIDARPHELTLAEIVKAINKKDEYLIKIIEDAGELLGNAIANIALILDLETVIIGGALCGLGETFMSKIEATIKQVVPFELECQLSSLGQEAGIYGLLVVGKRYIMSELIE